MLNLIKYFALVLQITDYFVLKVVFLLSAFVLLQPNALNYVRFSLCVRRNWTRLIVITHVSVKKNITYGVLNCASSTSWIAFQFIRHEHSVAVTLVLAWCFHCLRHLFYSFVLRLQFVYFDRWRRMFVAINVNLQIIHQIVKSFVYLSIISRFDSILKDFRRLFFYRITFWNTYKRFVGTENIFFDKKS